MVGSRQSLRERLGHIVFGYETIAGRAFDVTLLGLILASVLAVMLETVLWIREAYGTQLVVLEWIFTGVFTVEYGLRLWVARRPGRYVGSFFGVVDLLSILPSYVSLLLPGTQSLLVIRAVRLLRVFRILKLSRYLGEANVLVTALRSSGYKITVFVGTVLVLITIVATLMYLIEGPEHGFTSIPRSFYWAVVTMTTVGYGDIAPKTTLGQLIAGLVMLTGYSIIAVPTGIVSAEMAYSAREGARRVCPHCRVGGHQADSQFCRSCGQPIAAEVLEPGGASPGAYR